MKISGLALSILVVVALASCGSSSTLSSDQYNGLQAQGKQFASSMQLVGADASACAAKQKVGATGALGNLRSCLVAALGKAQSGLGKIASYTDNLSGQVDGACSTDLSSLSAAMADVEAIFAKAQTQAKAGNLTQMEATLKTIKSAGITTAGAAAEKSCKA